MMRKKKAKSSARFGARYGKTVRERFISIVSDMKAEYPCPQCSAKAVGRESVGIWRCRKCGLIFAGGAYLPVTKMGETSRRRARSAKAA